MNVPSGWELILVLLVVVVVFGSKRLPDSARALGRSMRILKAETKGLHDDDAVPTVSVAQIPAAQPVQTQPVQPQPVYTQPVQPQPVQVQPVQVQPAQGQAVVGGQPMAQPVTQPVVGYTGQQLFDAEGRPVQLPVNGSAPVQPAPQTQA